MAPKTPESKPGAKSGAKRVGKSGDKKLKTAKTGKITKSSSKSKKRPRNYDLGNGLYKFSRSKMYHKKAKYKFVGKINPKTRKPKRRTTIEKPIGGEKNGGKRIVLLKKRRNYYPTTKKINRHPTKKRFSQHKRYTRKSLTPGTICILVAGRHKGKRVVLLKILDSGLLLVTGPLNLNGCPLRRVSQNYVIATRTKLDIKGVKLPEHLNDKYFKRTKPRRQKKEEGDIFATKKEGYKVSDKRKSDQKVVDKAIMGVIKKHPDKKIFVKYLSAMFGLKKTQYPHQLVY